jgi:hypothetical protein
MITTNRYKDRLLSIAASFDSIVDEIKIIPSIKDWCSSNGITETSEDRAGKCLRNQSSGKHIILLAETVSDEEKESIIGAMSFHGSSSKDLEILTDEWAFVKHLLLHECAHAFNREFSEYQCDCWAFDKMKAISI